MTRGRVGRLLLALLGAQSGLLLFEVLLRIAGFSYVPLRIKTQNYSDWRNYHAFEDQDFRGDSRLLWAPIPGHVPFNAQGYRGALMAVPKPKGEFRVFAVGDSNTLGWFGEKGPNWPASLEALARSGSAAVRVVNAGVWGYSSFQGVRRLEDMSRFDPDLVLVSFGSNDAHQVTRADRDWAASPVRVSVWEWGLTYSRVGNLVLCASDAWRKIDNHTLVPRVSLAEYRQNLGAMVDLCKTRKATVVLLTRPFTGQAEDPLSWKRRAPEYNAVVRDICRARGLRTVDLYEAFRNRPELFHDESHFTDVGHEAAARIIHQAIRDLLPARP